MRADFRLPDSRIQTLEQPARQGVILPLFPATSPFAVKAPETAGQRDAAAPPGS